MPCHVTTSLSFFTQVLNAPKEPSVVPQELVMMLIHGQPDWTSRNWRSQYTSTFQKVLPAQHSIHRKQGRLVTQLSARRHPFHCYQCVKDTCVRLWHTLAKEGVEFRTIKIYLSVVNHMQIEAAMPDLFKGAPMAPHECVTRGIKKVGQRSRVPITPTLLTKMRVECEPTGTTHNTKILWMASYLCLFAFLRAGELTVPTEKLYDPSVHLSAGDVYGQCAFAFCVAITQSKLFWKGIIITCSLIGQSQRCAQWRRSWISFAYVGRSQAHFLSGNIASFKLNSVSFCRGDSGCPFSGCPFSG